MPDINSINQGIVNSVTGIKASAILTFIGWVVFALIIIGVSGWAAYYYYNRKTYNKTIIIHELINGTYQETGRDRARSVKLGSGGFEVLHLQKRKIYRIGYGSRMGRNVYNFYIMPDGYWYNGILSGKINSAGGVEIISTNPNARAQYTALEKYVDGLYSEKKGFWDKYGNWVLSLAFIVIIGVFAWLIFREISPIMNQFPVLIDKMSELVDKVNKLLVASSSGGLSRVG